MISKLIKRYVLPVLLTLGASQASQANVVAHYGVSDSGTVIHESVSKSDYDIDGNIAPMSIESDMGSVWRTDGYTSHSKSRIGNIINGEKMSAEIKFAIDTHVIILQDNNDANNQMAAVASCLNADAKSGFGFFLGRTGKYAFKVYVGGELVELQGNSLLPLWEWTSLCGTVDGKCVKLFLNGIEVATKEVANAGVKVTDTELLIGRDGNNNNEWCGARTADFNGAIASIEVRDDASVNAFTPSYADLNLPSSRYDGDRLRARYHGQPDMNWTNETHGLYYNPNDGKYHVFFQRTGSAPVMSHAHWGHIVSDNLFEWRDDKPVLNPSENYDLRGCWSGCVFTDEQITGGKPAILYTGVGYGPGESYAAMATCDDTNTLRKWTKSATNPILQSSNTWRDTYFFRTDENNAYFVIGADGCLKLYRYENGNWVAKDNFYTFEGGVEGGFSEMPNISKLSNGKWLMTTTPWNPASGVACLYRIGDIDGEGKFVNYSGVEKFDLLAKNGYGLMSPTIAKDKNGKLMALGIVADKMPTEFNLTHGYAHLYSLPREIDVDSDGRLIQKPFSGAEAMRGTTKTILEAQTLDGTVNLNPVRGREAEITATFVVGDAAFGFNFYKDSKGKGAYVSYNPSNHTVTVDFSRIKQLANVDNMTSFTAELPVFPSKGEEMKLQLFIDHSIIDVFVNDRYAASVRLFPTDDDADLIEVFSNGPTRLNSLEAYHLGNGDCSEVPVEPFVPKPVELPATSGKIAFLKSATEPSQQEQAALSFFQNGYKDATVLTTNDYNSIKASDFDCIWLHIDRKGIGQGYNNLPAEFLSQNIIDALKQFVADGGNLMLTGHATMMLEPLGRLTSKYAPNVVSGGNGDDGKDEWTVNTRFAGKDNSSHKIFSNLQVSENFSVVNGTYGLLWGGGESNILREDHNSMWNLGSIGFSSDKSDRVAKFEYETHSSALGTWGQVTNDEFIGIVEFYPLGEKDGTIIANGLAACQWYVENGENVNLSNLQLLTGNIFSYLASANGDKPDRPTPEDPIVPDNPVENEDLESTGKVALYLGYANEEELYSSSNRDEKAVYQFFKTQFPDGDVLFEGNESFISVDNYDCVWIHVDRMNITPDNNRIELPEAFTSNVFISALKQFVENGGNLYLSKHAVQIAHEMDNSKPAPNIAGSGEGQNRNADSWMANINHNSVDWTKHPIFQNIPIVESYGMRMIVLLSGDNIRSDRNSMWAMGENGHDRFCTENNARVLATWGHNGGDAMWHAGIVEFMPNRNSAAMRAISKDKIEQRKGTIIANGMAAYEWSLKEGTNESIANIHTLTSNILKYLSPVEEKGGISTGIDAVNDDTTGKINVAGKTLSYQGFPAGTAISVYTVDGRLTARVNGSVDGSLLIMNPGIIIVNVTNGESSSTYKFHVR